MNEEIITKDKLTKLNEISKKEYGVNFLEKVEIKK